MIADTSRISHAINESTGKTVDQISQLCNSMRSGKPYTSRDLVKLSGLERNAVTGRLNKMVNIGLAIELPRIRCIISGRLVHQYKLMAAFQAE